MLIYTLKHISIHAPLAGRDQMLCAIVSFRLAFQSTRPSRGATHMSSQTTHTVSISIHAPLAGRDLDIAHKLTDTINFNPRAPRGARRRATVGWRSILPFQSTRPSRGATGAELVKLLHEPLFQSTRPSRGATREPPLTPIRMGLSIHAPLAGRDSKCAQKSRTYLR